MVLELTFDNQTNVDLMSYEEKYRHLFEVVCKHLNLDGIFFAEIDIVSSGTIQQINKEYRKIDKVTDVISFAFEDNDEKLNYQDQMRDLGEIFICYDKAVEQAKEYDHSLEREMMFLCLHGFLHLLGYDHMTLEDEKVMFALQDEIMEDIGVKR